MPPSCRKASGGVMLKQGEPLPLEGADEAVGVPIPSHRCRSRERAQVSGFRLVSSPCSSSEGSERGIRRTSPVRFRSYPQRPRLRALSESWRHPTRSCRCRVRRFLARTRASCCRRRCIPTGRRWKTAPESFETARPSYHPACWFLVGHPGHPCLMLIHSLMEGPDRASRRPAPASSRAARRPPWPALLVA